MSAKNVGLVIAHMNYQPTEYNETKKALKNAQITITTISDQPGYATATDKSTTVVDRTLPEVNLDDIDGLFFIGGPDALQHLDNAYSHDLLQKANDRGMLLGGICLSVRILAKANVLVNKNATGWDGDGNLNAIFRQHSVHRVNQPVVVDGNCITAIGPNAASAFGNQIVNNIMSA